MAKAPTGNFGTVTVMRSWAGVSVSGATALVLETKEQGPIAFEIDRQGIALIRKALVDAERILAQPKERN
jgi:hypothetical protein